MSHTVPATECYHCGNPVPAAAPWSITLEDQTHPLCCPGCEAVAHAIVDGGLESYYRYRTELPERPDERQAAKADTWSVFDDPGLQAQFVHPDGDAGNVKATLAIEGITCAACVLSKAISSIIWNCFSSNAVSLLIGATRKAV